MFPSLLLCSDQRAGQMEIGTRRHFYTIRCSAVQEPTLSWQINSSSQAVLRKHVWLLKAVVLHQCSPAARLQHPAAMWSAAAQAVA